MICRIEKLDVKPHMDLSILVAGSVPKVGIELGYSALFGSKMGFAGLSQIGCTASKLTRRCTDLRGFIAGILGYIGGLTGFPVCAPLTSIKNT